jgi:hypothetical protein
VRTVEARFQQSHTSDLVAELSVTIGVSYPGLGGPDPESNARRYGHAASLEVLTPGKTGRRWGVPDPRNHAATERAERSLEHAWSSYGLPALDAWDDPRLLRDHLARGAARDLVRSAELSIALGEAAAARPALRAFLDELLTDRHLRQLGPREGPGLASISGLYLSGISLVGPAGFELTDEDVERARLVAAAARASRREHDSGVKLAEVLVELTGADPTIDAPPPSPVSAGPTAREKFLEARVRNLNEQVDRLKQQLHDLADALVRADTEQAESIREAISTDLEGRAAAAEFVAKGPPPGL